MLIYRKKLAFWQIYVDKGSNTIVFVQEIKNFGGEIAVFPKIMTISTHLAISNNMSSFVPKYWLNWKILVAVFNEFRRQRWDH